jgi:hypothetical protein
MDLNSKTMRYILAIIVCLGMTFLYIAIAALLNWEQFGGVIVGVIFIAAISATWKVITKAPKEETNEDLTGDQQQSESK